MIFDSVKGIKCQPWLMGLWVSKERKRGGEDRFWGWGAAMDDGEIFFSGKLDFDCVCLGLFFYLYISKLF